MEPDGKETIRFFFLVADYRISSTFVLLSQYLFTIHILFSLVHGESNVLEIHSSAKS